MNIRLLTLLLGMVAFAQTGFTQLLPEEDEAQNAMLVRLAQITEVPEIAEKIRVILQSGERYFSPSCAQIGGVTPVRVTVFDEPRFDVQGVPTNGSWMIRYKADACGTDVLRGILFSVDDNGVEISAMLPGNTLADPQLQADVTKSLKLAIMKLNPACKTPFVAGTNLLSVPSNGDAPWEELWVADMCGSVYSQAIRFVPQEEGTLFRIDIHTKER